MSARIAPEPVANPIAAATDYRSRATLGDTPPVAAARGPSARPGDEPAQPGPAPVDAPAAPPPPPGEAFAAAVIAGQLAPKPQTPQELALRLGSAWEPPATSLRLADRSA